MSQWSRIPQPHHHLSKADSITICLSSWQARRHLAGDIPPSPRLDSILRSTNPAISTMARLPFLSSSWTSALVTTIALFSTIFPAVRAANAPATIQGTNGAGVTKTLLVDRYPGLYTGNFGDCMGGQSLINLTSFDAAYYADNMTVLFNLAGTTNLRNETIIRTPNPRLNTVVTSC